MRITVSMQVPVAPEPPVVHPTIIASCAALDAIVETPRWDEMIDLDTFNIHSGDFCVLAQTGNKYGNAIPGDGEAPWYDYYSGAGFVREWLDEHPTAAERIGASSDQIKEAFDAELYVGEFDGISYPESANRQWELWIMYRWELRGRENFAAMQAAGIKP